MSPADAEHPMQCRHFGRCGGCSRLDQPYRLQLARRLEEATAALAPHLGTVGLQAPGATRAPRSYRCEITFPVRPHRNRLTMGMYRRGSHVIEEITECRLQAPALTELAASALELFRSAGLEPYDETTHRGLLRAFRARFMPGTRELLITLVTTDWVLPGRRRLVEGLLTLGSRLRDPAGERLIPVGVVQNRHREPGNALLGPTDRVLEGRGHQRDRVVEGLGGGECVLGFRASAGSFYQSHRHAGRLLYPPALDMLGEVRGRHVVDGFAGVGTFALRCAARGASVEIVESHPGAVADARANLDEWGLDDVRIEDTPFAGARFADRPDVMIVDPPRAGLGTHGVERVLRARPERLLYVSCSPRSLRRDLDGLAGAGYRVTAARLVDLFPHTEHSETVLLLER